MNTRCIGQMNEFLHIDSFAGKVALMRRFIALALIAALLVLSSAPLVSVAEVHADGMAGMSCSACHMDMAGFNQKKVKQMQMNHTQPSKGMRHCHIECCNHQDVGSLPHQLAPHAPALSDAEFAAAITDFMTVAIDALQPRLFSVPFPPPEFS